MAWRRIGGNRLEQKAGFEERRSVSKPLIAKNFSIAKNRDSESARRLSASLRRPAMTSTRDPHRMRLFRKPLRHSRFLQYRQSPLAILRVLTVSLSEKFLVPFAKKRRML